MDITGLISWFSDPIEFTRLCNTVFDAEYSNDYQVVDGTRADSGNDGYIRSEKRMMAFYCPRKPEKETDRKYIKKIEDDLRKAHKLHLDGKWVVERWTFVTPRPLPEPVLERMNELGSELGIQVHHLNAIHLAKVLLQNSHLLASFPSLYQLELAEQMSEIHSKIMGKEICTQAPADPSPILGSLQAPPQKSPDFEKALGIITNEQTDSSKAELRTIFYKSLDDYAQGMAILGLLQWYDPFVDNIDDMVAWCDRGVAITIRIDDKAHEAYFHAQKGLYLSGKFTMLDQQTAMALKADNLIGIQTISESKRQTVLKELDKLEITFVEEFKKALGLATTINDLRAYAHVAMAIGNAAGHRAQHFLGMGLGDRASREKETTLNALSTAKEAFVRCGDELRVGYAFHNMANQLRGLGERAEALELVKSAESIADKYDDFRLKQMSSTLRSTIESGRIPDYVHGERPERKK